MPTSSGTSRRSPSWTRSSATPCRWCRTQSPTTRCARRIGPNQALIELEEESFRRLAAGDSAGAYAAVTSGGYARLKVEYHQGMDVAIERMELDGTRQRAWAMQRQQLSLTAGGGAALLLALLWATTARGLRRSQRARGRVEEQLRVQAHADPLTGLANRRLFREHLTAALAAPDRGELAVLFADLDHFKTVNDTRGHADGDALLVEVAERITDLLHGHPGALVARLGGDEFAVLLPSTDEAVAEQLAGRLIVTLARPYAAAPQVPVTASVGLTVATVGDRDPGVLLRGADLAMYAAKSDGRGRWKRYAEHMHTDLLARVELESQLRDGLYRGELVVHYQPTHHLRTGRQHGVEALVRWQHPQRGLLPPGAFVPLAENSDLIIGLGRFVLEQACRQLAAWRAELGDTAPAQVAVNVSPRELNQHGYTAQVLAVLHLTGLPASCLVLEVTESTVMTEQSDVINVLTDLRAAGVRISIDDFGTGHSSLARLHELPVDEVKIDQSFVHAAAPDDTTTGDTTMLDRRARRPPPARPGRRGHRDATPTRSRPRQRLHLRPGLPARPPPPRRPACTPTTRPIHGTNHGHRPQRGRRRARRTAARSAAYLTPNGVPVHTIRRSPQVDRTAGDVPPAAQPRRRGPIDDAEAPARARVARSRPDLQRYITRF